MLRLLINAAALWVAIQLVDGIDHRGSLWSLLFVALVFGVLNASIRPLLKLLSLPLIILTLGLFIFVINALMLMLTGWVSGLLNLGFYVDGFWDAFVGGTHRQRRQPGAVALHRRGEDEGARGVTNASQLSATCSSSGVCLSAADQSEARTATLRACLRTAAKSRDAR